MELVPPDTLAALDPEHLAAAIRPLFEDAPWLAARLAGHAFASWDELIEAARDRLEGAGPVEQADVLRSHPRLGTDPRQLKQRSELSWREQGAGRAGSEDVLIALADANDRYEARFGFPFVDWVAGRSLAEMTGVIESRLTSDPTHELARGVRALVDIARDRLHKLRGEP